MSSKTQIRELVESFVTQLDLLIRQSVWETAQQSLGIGAAPSARAPKAGAAPRGAGRRRKGQKRNPAAITKLTEQLLAAIKAKPGQRMEQIGKTLGAKTAELQIPVSRLMQAKKIRRTGEKRATQYFPK